jgi:D-glucosaminate-6-phosphate ammonia-lyase
MATTTAAPAKPAAQPSIFAALGVKPVINACGIYTDLGGSRLSPRVLAAMEETNRSFVRMVDLLEKSGQHIAGLLGAEAAQVTPGAAAAIMLGTAACMAGTDGGRSERLPDTTGMKNEILIQRRHRYKYDRQVAMTGARLIEIGTDNGCNAGDIVEAITARTAMVLHPAHLDRAAGTVALDEVAKLAQARGVPVFVDAAYMNYPTDIMGGYVQRGADLVALSAKYFGGPNAGGFVMGRRDLIAAVANVHFTRYESGRYLKYGRPLKMDRQTVAAVVVALEEWLAMDHARRFATYARQAEWLRDALAGLRGVALRPMSFTMDERLVPEPVNCLVIRIDAAVAGIDAGAVAEALEAGTPSILAIREDDKIAIVMDVLEDEEVAVIAARLRTVLGAA